MTRVTLTTANTPGAVAIVQLFGSDLMNVLKDLTGRASYQDRRAYLVDFAGIDEGLAIKCDDGSAQLMPHGGPRVIQRLLEHLTQELGCSYDASPDTSELYPEAESRIEADMLDAIARAASPAAIDLLAAQPRLWRDLMGSNGEPGDAPRQAILARSRTLSHLIDPPSVVVAGPANVGKSTLTNALMGKSVSIVADLPGTTRDWVGGLVELSATTDVQQAIAVHWLDTTGLRESDDDIEQRAIQLARQQIERADVLIAMRDRSEPWSDEGALPRKPDLFVVNKVDDALPPEADAGLTPDQPLCISATSQRNLDRLQSIIIHQLGLDDLANEPWAFTKKLHAWCESGEQSLLSQYLDPIGS